MAESEFKLVFNDGEFLKGVDSSIKAVDSLIAKEAVLQNSYDKVFKTAADSTNKEVQALKVLFTQSDKVEKITKEIKSAQDELNKSRSNSTKFIDSVKEGYNRLFSSKHKWLNQSKEERTARIALLRQFADQKKALKDSFENFTFLGTSVKQLKDLYGGVVGVGRLWIQVLGKTKVAIAATGIGALVLALTAVFSYLTKTRQGQAALNKIMTVAGAIIEAITDKFHAFGEGVVNAVTKPKEAFQGLLDFLTGQFVNRFNAVGKIIKSTLDFDFEGVLSATTDLLTGVDNTLEKLNNGIQETTKSINELVGASKALSDSREALFDIEQELRRSFAGSRTTVKELNKIAEDTTKSYQERISAAKQAGELEVGFMKSRLSLSDALITQLKLSNQLEGDSDSKEHAEELTSAIESREAILQESLELQTTIQNKLNTITNEQIAKTEELKQKFLGLNDALVSQIVDLNLDGLTPVQRLQAEYELSVKVLREQGDILLGVAKQLGKPTEEIEKNLTRLIDAQGEAFRRAKNTIQGGLPEIKAVKVKGIDFTALKDQEPPEIELKFAPNKSSLEKTLERIGEELGGFFNDQSVISGLGFLDALADSLTAGIDAELSALDKIQQQRQEKIDNLRSDIELEQELLDEGSRSRIDGKQEELDSLLAQQEEGNRKQNELRKQQLKIDAQAALLAQIPELGLAVSKIFSAHAGIPFVGVFQAAAAVLTMMQTVKSTKQQIASLSLFKGASKISDYSRVIAPNSSSDLPGRGSRGYDLIESSTGASTGIRIGGEEMLVTGRTTSKIGDIIQKAEKDPTFLKTMTDWYRGVDSTPLIVQQAQKASETSAIINLNGGINKTELDEALNMAVDRILLNKKKENDIAVFVPENQKGKLITKTKGGKLESLRMRG